MNDVRRNQDASLFSAWAAQRVKYSRARRGRDERGAALAECALVEAVARTLARHAASSGRRPGVSGLPALFPAA